MVGVRERDVLTQHLNIKHTVYKCLYKVLLSIVWCM